MEVSTEDYLKALFHLQEESGPSVKTNALSEKLHISPSAVTDMLKKLAAKKYVTYAPYRGVTLTKEGRAIGCNIVRRHRILELYLHQKLGYSWDQVHAEAEQLEHAASDDLIQKMEAALGFPHFDPHGDPIPRIDGTLPVQSALRLSEGQKGRDYVVMRVSDLDAQFLHHLSGVGVVLQAKIQIKEILSFDRSLIISVGEQTHAISYFTAKHIWVAPEG